MKNKITKYIFIAISVLLSFSQCTEDFKEINSDPYGITNKSLEQDFNDIGAYFPNILRMLVNTTHYRYQIAQNLCSDSWAGYLASPTPFASGSNNTTYKMTWKDHTWNSSYDEIMAPSKTVLELAKKKETPLFTAWAKLIRVFGMQRVASLHGPIIYSQYGQKNAYIRYDSEEELYTFFFKELDEIVKIMSEKNDSKKLKKFDVSAYKGNVSSWIKLANTLRLQLALRIVKAKPELAKQEAEKAYKNSFGLISSNEENFQIDLGGVKHPLSTISNSWNDTRMSATMESFLVGYKDPRINKYFSPVADQTLVSNHTEFPFKGIKNGAEMKAKDERVGFSKVGKFIDETTFHVLTNAAEVQFMLAECKLRNWNVGTKSTEEYYAEGVRLSFTQWGISGADTYLANTTNKPIDYTDPKVTDPKINAFNAQTSLTIAWDESATNETKLERLITQKWIAGFPDSYEAWVDFRRTGYPKIEPVYKNDSDETSGIIEKNNYIKRMRFVDSEYEQNNAGVLNAIEKLGGEDKINTPLWWDRDGSNF